MDRSGQRRAANRLVRAGGSFLLPAANVPQELRDLFRHKQADEDLAEELHTHIELQTRKHVARGLSLEEARRRARLEFGGIESVKDSCRDERRANLLENFLRDFRHALRGMRRDPVLTLVALPDVTIGPA